MRHGQEKDRQGQRCSDPEPAGHVDQFGIVLGGIRRDGLELQGHSTDRAIARLIALDLRVHRAGVERPRVKFLLRRIFVRLDYLVTTVVPPCDEIFRMGVKL